LITSEQLIEIYPSLLERLDDAQDIIRLEIAKSFVAFFSAPAVIIVFLIVD